MVKIALLALLFVSPGPAGRVVQPLQSELSRVEDLIESSNLNEALLLLEDLAARAPENAEVLARLGEVYYRKAEYFQALDPLREALRLQPDHRRATQYRGASLYFLGRLEEALPDLEKALEWFPENVNFQNILGLCYVQSERTDKARRLFSKIFGLDSETAPAHLLSGRMFREQDVWRPAKLELERALQLDPKLPMAHLYLGEIAYAQRRLEDALRHFAAEVGINPGMWMAYYRSGEVLFELERMEEAVIQLQRALWLNKFFAGPYLVLGQIQLREKKLEMAIDSFRRAVRFDYTNPNAHYLLGRALSLAGQKEEAERELELSRRLREQQ